MTESVGPENRRRAGRVRLCVPIEIQGRLPDGNNFHEDTYTGMVGGLGAMIHTSFALPLTTEILVTNRFSQQSATFVVVWIGSQQTDKLWEIGIEALARLDDFWGVRFS